MAKTIIDPTKPSVADEFEGLSREELIARLKGGQTDEERRAEREAAEDRYLAKQAAAQAEANRRVMRPENQFHPDVSVYNPEGERDHPRVLPNYEMFWFGAPVSNDVNTGEEIALFQQLSAGRYSIQKSDGSKAIMIVSTERDTEGVLTKLKCNPEATLKGSEKHNWMPMPVILRDLIAQAEARKAAA